MMYNLGDSDIVEMEKSTSYNLKVDTMTFILNKDGNEINIILDNDESFHSKKMKYSLYYQVKELL